MTTAHTPSGRTASKRDATIYTVKPFGLLAVMVDCRTLENALHLHGHLQQHPAAGQTELVPAAQTVLVRFETAQQAADFLAAPDLPQASGDVRTHGRTVTIPVVYDGQDLTDVATHLGMSEQAVIYAHTTGHWSVAFAGFAPGFFYLHRHDNVLDVPRRSTPRTSVPAGAVGLAGDFSGIYPRTSPGGWQLIGRTNAPLWDLTQNPPALLEPGMQVQFEAVRELISAGQAGVQDAPAPAQQPRASSCPVSSEQADAPAAVPGQVLEVKSPGLLTLFQDSGRAGLTHWGVSPSGPADREAAAEANRLVGNCAGTTVLENLTGGLKITALADVELALTGADTPAQITEDASGQAAEPGQGAAQATGTPLAVRPYAPFALKPGQTLTLGVPARGLRTYLAVRGGFAARTEAVSASRDTLAGLGPKPLAAGERLSLANPPVAVVADPAPALPLPEPGKVLEVRALPGPRDDWFTPDSLGRFAEVTWEVSQSSDRIGVRLLLADTPADGGAGAQLTDAHPTDVLTRAVTRELPSEGMVAGAIQVPPSGEPVVFLADHPVTGGYPVIATVHPADLRLLAQAPPGARLRFTLLTPLQTTPTPTEK
ncbi:carboxyltransferase domain-containing protein [Rothia nasimurium]|uniref:5-oxoprolinase subunit B/C family protein n=2 Tax=Rothia nasimurium TaxID=85336 RepID=UPI001F289AC0|nr:carboxyltransferase domain-containing protein [Rothia nasimurium]